MLTDVVLVIGGLALLVGGAQSLVRGASRLALAFGIAPLVVGLTIVAFGTSAPELAVSVQSSLAGKSALVLGNVVGSTIYNVLFILGLCAVITPLAVAPRLIRLDVPVTIVCAAALYLAALDGRLGRLDGALLLAAFAVYTLLVVVLARREQQAVKQEYAGELDRIVKPDRRHALHVVYLVAGIALLGLGSNLLVEGAVAIAQSLGVSEVLIGMTVVTIGTTAPELSASLVAAWKGEKDIAVGNIVGSNIFNLLPVLGTGAVVAPDGIVVDDAMRGFGIPVMVAVCFSCLPIFFAGQAIRRWEGALFLVYFAIYLTWLILDGLRDPRILGLQRLVLWFVGPLTVLTLAVSVYGEVRRRRSASAP
ncbi:MAG TPA: calcium/sodium antiporter [Gammaproteobacteria bacterium]|nr:calcium/sodium antiporter [Gammaproteobacteria bacterium]